MPVTCIAFAMSLTGCSTTASTAAAAPPIASEASWPARAPFRATGNEPSWRLDITPREMTLLTDFGQARLVAPTPAPKVDGATQTYVARTNQGELVVTITDQLCVDSMSGMPHPQTVQVMTGGQVLAGCGGEPASLLQGAEWSVVKIDGAPLAAGSQVTIGFSLDGQVSGKASCNRFMSEYTLTGEGLALTQAAGTRMLCDDALMEQERIFLAILGGVRNFSIAADGALLLRAGDGRTIEARR